VIVVMALPVAFWIRSALTATYDRADMPPERGRSAVDAAAGSKRITLLKVCGCGRHMVQGQSTTGAYGNALSPGSKMRSEYDSSSAYDLSRTPAVDAFCKWVVDQTRARKSHPTRSQAGAVIDG